MLESELLKSTSSWPFVEIRKLLKDRDSIIKKKNKIIFQTGYGPSGLPHIGTFGEVSRTSMMINALKHIKKIETELITFSDDLDALRKVPEDYPFPDKLKNYINCPLSMIPDFTGQYESYADRNNNLLKSFLNKFKFSSCHAPKSRDIQFAL